MLLSILAVTATVVTIGTGSGDADDYDFDQIDAQATTGNGSEEPPPPPPPCVWSSSGSSVGDRAREQGFWARIDGGDHADDVIVFFDNGALHRTFNSTQTTYVLQRRICDDPDHTEHGERRWTVVGPPDPTVYWDELTERVTRRVPLPQPDLGVALATDGSARIPVQLGLWIAVTNPDDIVARAEPAPGIWAETRATLTHIEYLSGTGNTSGPCPGAGTPLPDHHPDIVEQGPCGYTYTDYNELGHHTATLRATWTVTNTTSTGNTQQRPDIIVNTPIPIDVYEIQTVGTD